MNYRNLSPAIAANLERQQREADRQAAVWVNREIIRSMGCVPLTRREALERWPSVRRA